jgi:Fur family ferric uptake transcriptional regulator
MPSILDSYNEDENRDTAQDIIWMAGIKATKPRMVIVKALENEKHPVSIVALHRKMPEISRASIYRTLESLVEHGSVNRINTGGIHPSYEISFGRKHHHHIICTKCSDIEDVESISMKKCPAQKAKDDILDDSKKFKVIHDHSLEFFGLCKKCA